MSFRIRLLLTVVAVALASLAVLAIGWRSEVRARLTADYERRVAGAVTTIEADLQFEGQTIDDRLEALRSALQNDARFSSGVGAAPSSERRYVRNYTTTALRLTGLDVLQIQDAEGRILSAGQFLGEHGGQAPALAERILADQEELLFVTVRTPDRSFMALARGREFQIEGRRFVLVGGISLDGEFLRRLARNRDVAVSLLYPGLTASSDPNLAPLLTNVGLPPSSGPLAGLDDQIAGRFEMPVVGADGETPLVSRAYVAVTHTQRPLQGLLLRLDSWFIGTATATGLAALFFAVWLSSRVSRPLAALAEKTAVLDLDRLDIDFAPRGTDEVGTLSQLLADLTARLRTSARHLREAERRAAVGQIARQVTHDIKNGLIPLRNVFRHLSQLDDGDKRSLSTVFHERRGTIDASIEYLETLAGNYARLSPTPDRRPCDLNAIVSEAVRLSGEDDSVELRVNLSEGLPPVVGDPIAFRRILDNLIANAIDSLVDGRGTVTITTRRADNGGQSTIRLTVADTGCGMTDAETEKIFNDFYTTKATGSGLGLSIVRRLVLDSNGTVSASSRPGGGTVVTVDTPVDRIVMPEPTEERAG